MYNQSTTSYWSLLAVALVGAFFMFAPDLANADIGGALCNAKNQLTGPAGKAIAMIAVIAIGLGALFGKISWGLAIMVGTGVAVIFGADTIVTWFGGGNC